MGTVTGAVVTGISWERIRLHLEVAVLSCPASPERLLQVPQAMSDGAEFYLADEEGHASALFDMEDDAAYRAAGGRTDVDVVSGNASAKRLHMVVNITNNGTCSCIPGGRYRLMLCRDGCDPIECEIDPALAPVLRDRSRVFHFGIYTPCVYTVSFYVRESDTGLPFRVHISHSEEADMFFPGEGHVGSKLFKEFITYTLINQKPNVRRFYRLQCALHRNSRPHNILFLKEQSDRLGENQTTLLARMRERGLDRKYHIHTLAYKKIQGDHNLFKWMERIAMIARCGILIVDDHVPTLDWLRLARDTLVIQTWHAGAGFKSSGYSRWGQLGSPAPYSAHRQYTYGLCGSRKIAHFFSEVWGINTENVLNTGMPRMDEYQDPGYQEKTRKELYERFPLCRGKKVILFAPTYRGRNNADAYYPYELIDWERLDAATGDEYVVLFKMHPWVIKPIDIPERYAGKFLDVRDYPKINDLFYITDLLITDYSSNIYEYSLMRKPMLFFAYDEIQYSFSRGFHRPYRESAPGKVCATFDELCAAIEKSDFEYEKVKEYITNQFDHFDSGACDRVIDWLIEGDLPPDVRQAIDRREERVRKMLEKRFTKQTEVEKRR